MPACVAEEFSRLAEACRFRVPASSGTGLQPGSQKRSPSAATARPLACSSLHLSLVSPLLLFIVDVAGCIRLTLEVWMCRIYLENLPEPKKPAQLLMQEACDSSSFKPLDPQSTSASSCRSFWTKVLPRCYCHPLRDPFIESAEATYGQEGLQA